MVRQEGRGEDRRQVELMHRQEAESGMRWLLRCWWFWAGAGFMLVAVVVGYLVIPVDEGRISQANCDRIQLGWTLEDVKSLSGEPTFYFVFDGSRNGFYWFDDDGNMIRATIGLQGVAEKEFVPTTLSFFERVKRRIERRIRAIWP
jgi:hypothetical protein